LRYFIAIARTRMLFWTGVFSSSSSSAVMLRGGPGVISTLLVGSGQGVRLC